MSNMLSSVFFTLSYRSWCFLSKNEFWVWCDAVITDCMMGRSSAETIKLIVTHPSTALLNYLLVVLSLWLFVSPFLFLWLHRTKPCFVTAWYRFPPRRNRTDRAKSVFISRVHVSNICSNSAGNKHSLSQSLLYYWCRVWLPLTLVMHPHQWDRIFH